MLEVKIRFWFVVYFTTLSNSREKLKLSLNTPMETLRGDDE
jgi:hypothetical protein